MALLTGGILLATPAARAQTCTQTISSNANATYNITTANSVICVTANSLARDITIDAANCTVSFGGGSYSGTLTITANGTNCTVLNNGGSTISGPINDTGTGLTINSNGTISGSMSIGGAGATIINTGTISGSSNTISAATTINNMSIGTWSGNFYNGSGRITAPLTVNNAGLWGNGNQLEAWNDLTFTNTGTVNATFYGRTGLTSQAFVLTNSGTWSGQVGANFVGRLSITNNSSYTWGAAMSLGTLTAFSLNNQGTWSAALGTFTVSSPATATITNAGIWNNVGFGVLNGTAVINNSGVWNNTQVSVSGGLTINHSNTTANTWKGVPVNESALTVNNSGNWGLDISFPSTGPNAFNTLSGGTTALGNGLTINGNTAFQNSGAFTISKSGFVLPAGSSISNLAGTFNLSGGVDNRGSISNVATLNATTYQTSTNVGTLTNTRPGQVNVSSSFTNSGTVSNSGTVATTGSFTNSGTISGPAAPLRGSFTVTGVSVNSGVFGSNTTANRLNFCDSSSGNGGSFDTQSGTVGTSTTICSATPLPVELTRFDATTTGGRVVLTWATASEKNSAYFAVERSADGREFARIAEAKAQGSATVATEYRAADEQPLPGLSYYRLRQVDADGTANYSPVVSVNSTGIASLSLAPNPVADVVLVNLTGLTDPAATMEVRTLSGKLLLAAPAATGTTQPLNMRELPAGVYLLQVRTAGHSLTQRLLKL
jgi:hypothetical protein